MRSLSYAASAVLIVSALTIVGRSWSEGRAQPLAPRARVAVVNIAYVIKNSPKCKAMQAKTAKLLASPKKQSRELQDQIKDITEELKDQNTDPQKRTELELRLGRVKRQMEDVLEEAKRSLNKEIGAMIAELYADAQHAAERYAKNHGIDLVLQYPDTTPGASEDINNLTNIRHRLESRGGMPLYAAPGVDISRELVAILNGKSHPAKRAR